MNGSTRSVRVRALGAALTGLLLAACGLGGCDDGTPPPPAPVSANTPGTTGGQGGAATAAGGGGGPLSNLSEGPKSMYGRSAKTGKDVVKKVGDEQSAVSGLAGEMNGESLPVEVAGIVFPAPAGEGGWAKVSNPGPTRAAQLTVPGAAGEATVAFFFFPGGQGGDVQMNLARWKGQVKGDDGKPAEAEVSARNVNGVPVTLITMEGTYTDGMGAAATPREGWAFRGAIVQGARGNVFVKFTGPKATVEGAQGRWDGMIGGLRKG